MPENAESPDMSAARNPRTSRTTWSQHRRKMLKPESLKEAIICAALLILSLIIGALAPASNQIP